MRQYHDNAPIALTQTLLAIEEAAILYTKLPRGADGTLPPDLEASVLDSFRRHFDRVQRLLGIESRGADDLRAACRSFERLYFDKCGEVENLQARIDELESTNTL